MKVVAAIQKGDSVIVENCPQDIDAALNPVLQVRKVDALRAPQEIFTRNEKYTFMDRTFQRGTLRRERGTSTRKIWGSLLLLQKTILRWFQVVWPETKGLKP